MRPRPEAIFGVRGLDRAFPRPGLTGRWSGRVKPRPIESGVKPPHSKSRLAWAVVSALGALLLAGTGFAANVAPYAESFEGFDHGALIITNSTAGWSGAVSNAGVVTTNPIPIGALAAYTNGLPLPGAPHAKVLEMSEALTNSIATATGGVVIVDLLALPAQREAPPEGSTNYQFACYIDTNNQLVVWHYDSSVPTNTWLALTNSPTTEIGTGAWSRLTVWQDYSNKLFQVAVNGHAPIQDAKGWTTGGGARTGTWFRMVGTNNAYLSRFRHQGEMTSWLDDLVVTNRSVSWSGTSFAESAANDGSVATTQTLTLYGDTFASTTYSTGTHFTVSGVPAGLSVTLTNLNPTQLVVSLSGRAAPHTAAATTNAMSLTLLSPAFTLGGAGDVGGFAQSGMSVTFADPPVLTYAGAPYVEGSANNGSIGNTVTITLSGGETFTNVSPLVAGTHYTTSGIPAGLSLLLTANSATQLVATLTNAATSHGSGDSTAFTLTFLSAAFAHVAASNVLGSATNLDIQFVGSAQLVYSTNVFSEAPANDGTVLGGTIDILGDLFQGAVGEDFVAAGKVLTNHVPAGLSVAMTLNAASNRLTVAFGGSAASHTNANDVTDLTFTFTNSAFLSSSASSVSNYNRGNLGIDFHDQPVMSYSGAGFSESGANDGTIQDPLTITLSGTTFAGANGVLNGTQVTADHVPAGLTAVVTKTDDTHVTVQLTGTAFPHRSSSDTSSLSLHFHNEAFNTVQAGNIIGAERNNLSVTFIDTAGLVYSTNRFAEAAANDGSVLGGTIALTGDEFAGTNNEAFASDKVAFTNVPAGLTGVVTRTSATLATVTFSGNAAAHVASNSVSTLGLTFFSAAFAGGNAGGVTASQRGDLAIDFLDQPVLNYSGTNFAEAVTNDGTIGNSLTITLVGTTFAGTNGMAFGADRVTADHVPAGLTAVVTQVDSNTVSVQLTGTATVHRTSSNTSTLSLQFHDSAFNAVLATNITGAARDNLSVTFLDAAVLVYSTNRFAEAAANDGTVVGGMITLTGDGFTGTNGDIFAADKVAFTNVPAGLTGVVTRTSATLVTLSFAGQAASHVALDSVSDLGLTFLSAAFAGGNAGGVTGSQRGDLAIDFRNPPVLGYTPSGFVEATANDGSIGNSVLFTLTGDTFTNVAFLTAGVHFTTSGVPAGLGFQLRVENPTQVTARLTGNALPHDSSANGVVALSFLNAAFANVATDRIAGATAALPVNFDDPPVLTYSGNTFRESNYGAIENSLTITLSSGTGEAFAGADGSDFAASNWVAVSTMPNFLTAVVTRVSATVLNVTLTGAAQNNTSANNVTDMTLTFRDAAFTRAKASEVQNYLKNDLRIEFRDAVLYVNRVPYRESFESYTNGGALGEELGWSPTGAGVVTAETALVSALTNGFTQFPLVTNHVQILRMTDEVSDEILSGAGGLLYSEMMVYVTPREQEPVGSTNYQFAMYVDTNQNVVVWHQDTSGVPSNTWLTLTGAPPVTTGAWHRVTVVQDQSHFRYQLFIDGSRHAVSDAAGYSDATGMTHPGPWFNMVNRNGYLSRVRVQGIGETVPGYMDDLVVDIRGPDFVYTPGTVFKFR